MSGAVVVAILIACGTYLVLQRGIVRITFGFVLLAHGVNVLLLLSGGSHRRGAPIVGEGGLPADPLPQAFALTAIVITFGITAFLLGLAFRSRDVLVDDDTEREQ
ncbi:MAG: NADH-quinone oxidoreductase subunit K [Actinomycetota bacterium]|nr:NADH-quinone oxidoreductase subunit K [Actinomycetota bacterium]